MAGFMHRQGFFSIKGLLTKVTFERAFLAMNYGVACQLKLVCESLLAQVTLMDFDW